jgi:hypothetical protein
MNLSAGASPRSQARSVRWPRKHRSTEVHEEGSFFFGGTHRGEGVPNRTSRYPLNDSFCDSVFLWQAHRCVDAGEALRGRANIGLKNPKISHQTLKPGPYGARTSFMRLP